MYRKPQTGKIRRTKFSRNGIGNLIYLFAKFSPSRVGTQNMIREYVAADFDHTRDIGLPQLNNGLIAKSRNHISFKWLWKIRRWQSMFVQ